MSGSSVYYKSHEENKHVTIGVHVKGYRNEGYNAGTFLFKERIEHIKEWIESFTTPTKHNLQRITSEVYGRDSELDHEKQNKVRCYRFIWNSCCGRAQIKVLH